MRDLYEQYASVSNVSFQLNREQNIAERQSAVTKLHHKRKMKNTYYTSNGRKIAKHLKVGFYTEWRLKRLGRNDCSKNVIRQDNDGRFSSPFLKKEISLCMAAIQKEKETLYMHLAEIDTNIAIQQLRVKRREECINRIQNDITNAERLELLAEASDDMNVSSFNYNPTAYTRSECYASVLAKTNQIDNLSKSVENSSIKIERNLKDSKCKLEVTKSRCQQLYELLNARLSMYWAGVLEAEPLGTSVTIPPIFDIGELTHDIETEIENITRELQQ